MLLLVAGEEATFKSEASACSRLYFSRVQLASASAFPVQQRAFPASAG